MYDSVEVRCEKHRRNFKFPYAPAAYKFTKTIRLPCGCMKTIKYPAKKEKKMKVVTQEQGLTALGESVDFWKLVSEGKKESDGTKTCPLCKLYHCMICDHLGNEEVSCIGCPIFRKTGEIGCKGTPYWDYEKAKAEALVRARNETCLVLPSALRKDEKVLKAAKAFHQWLSALYAGEALAVLSKTVKIKYEYSPAFGNIPIIPPFKPAEPSSKTMDDMRDAMKYAMSCGSFVIPKASPSERKFHYHHPLPKFRKKEILSPAEASMELSLAKLTGRMRLAEERATKAEGALAAWKTRINNLERQLFNKDTGVIDVIRTRLTNLEWTARHIGTGSKRTKERLKILEGRSERIETVEWKLDNLGLITKTHEPVIRDLKKDLTELEKRVEEKTLREIAHPTTVEYVKQELIKLRNKVAGLGKHDELIPGLMQRMGSLEVKNEFIQATRYDEYPTGAIKSRLKNMEANINEKGKELEELKKMMYDFLYPWHPNCKKKEGKCGE